jgi:hypothetical protein
MKHGVEKTFWKSSIQLCDLQVQGPLKSLTLDGREILAEFRDYSSVVSHAASGLQTPVLGLLRLFDDLVGHCQGILIRTLIKSGGSLMISRLMNWIANYRIEWWTVPVVGNLQCDVITQGRVIIAFYLMPSLHHAIFPFLSGL